MSELRQPQGGVQTSERSNAEAGLRRWIVGTLRRLAGGSSGPLHASWRLFRRSVAGPSPVRLDPFGTIDLLHQALKDLALTREQQEVFERVVSCNARFWQIAVDGCLDGSPPWRRHVALNLALLRVYHRHLAAQRIVDELTSPLLGSLSYPEAVEALRYCRWALAAYSGRGLRDGTEKIQSEGTSKMAAPVNANMPCSPSSVLLSDLDDTAQASDPLCPRFLLAEDVERGELIISVRGTQSLSDLFADLVGDAEDFAGGKAHAGILHTARRLLERLHPHLKEGLSRLDTGTGTRLVLCGHSLGAGVCQLLAVLLLGGEKSSWTLPRGTELRCFLFAPPPVFGIEPVQRTNSFSRILSFRFRPAVPSAVERVREATLAFAVNYDIIPRTSLHNGYKLFQEARVIDDFVVWGKREVLRKLGQTESESQVAVALELQDALCKGASSRPAPGNPFPTQHAVTSRLFHVVMVPGGTAAFSSPTLSLAEEPSPAVQSDQSERDTRLVNSSQEADQDAAPGPRACGRWVLKRSDHLRQWRRRFAWIEAGDLCFALSPKDPLRSSVPLTADSTLIMLLGQPSSLPFPAGMNATMSFRPDEPASGTTAESTATIKATRDFATPWAFHVQTASCWSGIEPQHGRGHGESAAGLPSIQSCAAAEVFLCTESAAERDAWLTDLAAAVREARRRCIRVLPAVSSEDFGREALLADGLMNDHDAGRYEVALEALIDQLRCVRDAESPTEQENVDNGTLFLNVTTVDVARVFRENIREDDSVVMRMDCEGSEYELLRHLMLSGWLCKLRRLYLEAHAMTRPKLNKFRTFDVLLPWLLEPCGTEVFVDTGYHNTAESLALWPKQDGVCRWCPMLYVPFQGASHRRCPAGSIWQCFDETYTCERCCNAQRFGAMGDEKCWRRGRPVAEGRPLKSGGIGYSLPDDVLQRILESKFQTKGGGEAILRLVGPEARPEPSPAIFSYEMCCASMVGELVPGLAPFFHSQSSGEYYRSDAVDKKPHAALPPWKAKAAKEAATKDANQTVAKPETASSLCANFAGLYQDSGGGVVQVSQLGCTIHAENAAQRWSADARADGVQVFLWEHTGALKDGFISWSNQAVWVLLHAEDPAARRFQGAISEKSQPEKSCTLGQLGISAELSHVVRNLGAYAGDPLCEQQVFEFFGLSDKGCCGNPGNISGGEGVLVVDTVAAEAEEEVKTLPSSKALEDGTGKTPTTTCGLSFGDPSPSSWGASPTSPGTEDFCLSKTGSALTEGGSVSGDFEALQLPELPDKAPLEEDQIVVSGLKARMQKARENLAALRERVQVEILQGRAPQSPEEARELGFYSTSTLMRYLCMQDGDVNKALKAMKDTMEWRKRMFHSALFPQGSSMPCCRACMRDPLSHCFLCVGKDVLGRHVIYSCTGRAGNKTPEDGIEHMASEMERLFRNSTMPGSVAWIVDFAGFGFADCNPKIGALAFPMFASHYPERFGQIVCLSLPYAFYPIYAAGNKIFDKETMAKVKILKGDKDWKRYGDAYWSHDPGMRRWLDAAVKCKGVPGGFPSAEFTQDLQPGPEHVCATSRFMVLLNQF
ncbi:Dagla [Symbiodinium natans]|uniref:sn-1-specific diacylglycerol lipase n=1 Tax=Symbiodinium natans TaxID=878477 RepID=A0A812PJ05_9DINO|nr:Dagla [Symbiodinium natans]